MRLSETSEVQWAFRSEILALFGEAGVDQSIIASMIPGGTLDGGGLLKAYDSLRPDTFENLGFRPEQVRVLKSLTSS